MNYIARITQDEYPENPRLQMDCLGTLCYKLDMYDSFTGGDKNGIFTLYDAVWFVYHKGKMTVSDSERIEYEIGLRDVHDLAMLFKKYNMGIILPVWITGNGNGLLCGDMDEFNGETGERGYIFVTHENIRKNFNVKSINNTHKERVISTLKDEVKVYSAWCEGEVYYVTIYTIDDDKAVELYVEHELEIEDYESWSERDWQNALPYLTEDDSGGGFYGRDEVEDYVKEMTGGTK